MPIDLFKARGINVDQPRDLFAEKGINPKTKNNFTPLSNEEKTRVGESPYYAPEASNPSATNWEELTDLAKNLKGIGQGVAQSVVNYPKELANIAKTSKYNNLTNRNPFELSSFAPDNAAGHLGQAIGDVGTFFLPGGSLKAIKPINALAKVIKTAPFGEGALSVAKNALNAGTLAAAKNSKDPGAAFLKGSQEGGLWQLGANAITSKIPILSAAAHAIAAYGGYKAGEAVGHPDIGATVGMLIPTALKEAGIVGKNAISDEALSGLSKSDVEESVLANRRLGTHVTPGQASGNNTKTSQEASAKTSVEGAQEAHVLEKQQKAEQSAAINNMLDKIYKPTPKSEKAIKLAYDKAYTQNLHPDVVEKLRENPVVDDAFNTVSKIPRFKDIAPENYEYLAKVKRILRLKQKGQVVNAPDDAYATGKVIKGYDKFLKDTNADYKNADSLAQPRIVRRNLVKKLNRMEEDYSGKNFHDTFLNKKNNYDKIMQETNNFPLAQKDIEDMRIGWKNLSNLKTAGQGAAQSEQRTNQARNFFQAQLERIKNAVGAKGDKKALQYIHSKRMDYLEDFDRIAKIADIKERNKKWLNLFGSMAEAGGLIYQNDEEE